ncbi:hypothetical protein CHS0354_040511 [Potamilus streckersoni]|uniref:Fibronectin type-III domain-containing protein n=1 Tax=Potamilus streckersoni TaxID=2493646 RepID=A0AAE0TKX1_9BIVA|nr:hypothetical protein CHS0354_040511 [Potamilus streckersoni]
MSSKEVSMAIKITSVQQEGTLSAYVEWVATDQVDYYEISYFCDPGETVLRPNIVTNTCRLTSLKWDSEYTIKVTAYHPDGKTSFDSVDFKTDPKVKESNQVGPYMSSKEVSMAIKITSVQQEETMSADVEWVVTDQVDHYEISYFCDPGETVLRPNIVTNTCRLTSLKWDSEYTIKVTAYHPDGKTSFDSVDFKTDPKVKDNKPAIRDISPNCVKLAVTVTSVQKAGMMSADVEWSAIYPTSQYQVSYSCSPDETVLLKKITENRCRLANLRWDSTYTIKVTTQLDDGTTVCDQQSFKTDPEVKCFPMAVAEICSEKIDVIDSFDEFTASNRIKEGVSFNKIGEFSGIVLTPVLTEDRHFWRMNIDLSIFEEQSCNYSFLDFGIVTYSNLKHCTGLTNNKAAYSCTILQKIKRKICLEFHSQSNNEGCSYPLPVNLHQKSHFSYGFLYDKINSQFAVMDCQRQEVLHVFHNVYFLKSSPIFAIRPYHTECKMRVRAELYYMHCIGEDVSSWMRKIAKF